MLNKIPLSHKQAGGTFLGMVIGLIVGLAIAVLVALFIYKSDSPILNNNSQVSSDTIPLPTNPTVNLDGQPQSNTAAPLPTPTQTTSGLLDQPQIVEVNPGTQSADAVISANHLEDTKQAASSSNTQSSSSAPPAAPKITNANPNIRYILQIGAYKNNSDAQQQRANLAFQGFESTINQKEINGINFYRVRIGPFKSTSDMNDARQRLANAGYNSDIIRETK